MKKIILILGFIGFFSLSCSHKATVISPLASTENLSPSGFIYALPQTSFKVKVESVHYQVVPGPFAEWAEKYLGVTGCATQPKAEWSISSVDVFSASEADLDALFVVEPSENFRTDFLRLTTSGLVMPFNAVNFIEANQYSSQSGLSSAVETSTDLSPTPFIAAERTTHYSRVLQDSAFVRVPVHKTVVVEKSMEEKAREAAEFIFSLRKRRFELLSGDADFVAEGKAVETVLNEISRLENEYVSLFIGKSAESKSIHWFDFTPDPNGSGSTILFRFSPSKGVLPQSDLSGSPVLITASGEKEWKGVEIFEQLSSEKRIPRTDALYYRMPVPIMLKISFQNTELLSKRMSAFQFGPLVRMPSRFFINESGDIQLVTPKK